MRKRHVFGSILAAAALGYTWLSVSRVGELPPVAGGRARVYAGAEFSPAAWRAAGPAARGRMVASLARGHRFVGRDPAEVRALLGPITCYRHSEEVPCYRVTFGGTRYDLVFRLAYEYSPMRLRVRAVDLTGAGSLW